MFLPPSLSLAALLSCQRAGATSCCAAVGALLFLLLDELSGELEVLSDLGLFFLGAGHTVKTSNKWSQMLVHAKISQLGW